MAMKKSDYQTVSPWQLSPREADVLDALIANGCAKRAAPKLGITLRTVDIHRGNAKRKLAAAGLTPYLIVWDRWRQSQKTGEPT